MEQSSLTDSMVSYGSIGHDWKTILCQWERII